jgi:hypothetical protein
MDKSEVGWKQNENGKIERETWEKEKEAGRRMKK